MERCSPVEMRKNIEVVEIFKNAGIDFVPVPVLNDDDKEELVELLQRRFDEIVNGSV